MVTYDPMDTANTVFGIAGTGISLGLLAGMGRNIMRSTEPMYGRNYYRRPPVRANPYRNSWSLKRPPQQFRPRLSIKVKPMRNRPLRWY